MGYEPISPFRRALNAAAIARGTGAGLPAADDGRAPARPVDKWAILRTLGTARKRLGVTDRQLGVLQALLGFHRSAELRLDDPAGLVVHAANETISARLNGMPLSTLRRHLAALVAAGLVARRDSPNGKRYVRRHRDGAREAFGFSLAPLVHRADEIMAAAEGVRAEDDECMRLRRDISLMRRDLAAALERLDAGTLSHALERPTRRSDSLTALAAERNRLAEALQVIERAMTEAGLIISDDQIERHNQITKEDKRLDSQVSEARADNNIEAQPADHTSSPVAGAGNGPIWPRKDAATPPPVLVDDVLAACPDLKSYATHELRTWQDLVSLTLLLRPMMGVSNRAWQEVTAARGVCHAVLAIAKTLSRLQQIRHPSAYFRALALRP